MSDPSEAALHAPGNPWLLAARPKTLHAAAAPVFMGGAMAWHDGAFAGFPFAAALTCALLIQIGTNFANDYSDYVRGADTEERVGFTRATQAGWITPASMRRGIWMTFLLALLPGVYLVFVGGWPILVIGVAAITAGLAYTGGPWPFGYHGLGEPFVFLFFGLIAVAGTYWVAAGQLRSDVLLAGAGIGALDAAILVVNNLRDRETDARAGKRTLAVRFGVTGTRVEYTSLLGVGALVLIAGTWWAGWPAATLIALLGVAAAAPSHRRVWSFRQPEELNEALAGTSRAAGFYGALFAIGFVL